MGYEDIEHCSQPDIRYRCRRRRNSLPSYLNLTTICSFTSSVPQIVPNNTLSNERISLKSKKQLSFQDSATLVNAPGEIKRSLWLPFFINKKQKQSSYKLSNHISSSNHHNSFTLSQSLTPASICSTYSGETLDAHVNISHDSSFIIASTSSANDVIHLMSSKNNFETPCDECDMESEPNKIEKQCTVFREKATLETAINNSLDLREAAHKLCKTLPYWKNILGTPYSYQEDLTNLKVLVNKERSHQLTVISNPIPTVNIFFYSATQHVISCVNLGLQYYRFIIPIISLSIATIMLLLQKGYTQELQRLSFVAEFFIWWVGLGVLSSVGLGCGLHSGVLFLVPYIFSICMTSEECNSLDFDPTTSMWSGQAAPGYVFPCHSKRLDFDFESYVTFWGLLTRCLPAGLLWGFGTAIGELPPYALSYLVAQGRLNNESDIIDDVRSNTRDKSSYYSKIHDKFYLSTVRILERYGAIGVFLLFDVCGVLCGQCLMPFWRFFIALYFGKGVVKVLVQLTFLIFIFSKRFDKQRAHWISEIAKLPPLSHWVDARFDSREEFETFALKKLQIIRNTGRSIRENDSEKKTLIRILAQYFLGTIMILFIFVFICSLVNQVAQQRAKNLDEEFFHFLDIESRRKKKNQDIHVIDGNQETSIPGSLILENRSLNKLE